MPVEEEKIEVEGEPGSTPPADLFPGRDRPPTPLSTDEGQTVRQADVRTLPRDQAARAHHGHLHEPASQATTGVNV
jgi:hypothetical protein